MTIEESSLRDSLDAAFEKSAETPETSTPEPVQAELPLGDEPAAETPPAEAEKPPVKAETTKPDVVKDKVVEETVPPVSKVKAPGSWKPAAREQWATLPASIQQEVLRRERDIATGFNEVAAVKKFRDEFGSLVNQHQQIIQAEGGDAMKMTRDLYTTAAALYNGSQQQKVMTVAGMIKNFGIDLRMLDNVLAGQGAPAAPQQQDAMTIIRREIQAALHPILSQRTQEMEQNVHQSITEFAADPTNEFFEDVKDDMADLLEIAAKRGQKMDLSTAYKRATMMHSEIADVIAKRTLRSKAEQNGTIASQARKRAVSLRSTPPKELASGNVGEQQNSLGDDLRNAIDALSG